MGDSVDEDGVHTLKDLAARPLVKPGHKASYKVMLDGSRHTLRFSTQQIYQGHLAN